MNQTYHNDYWKRKYGKSKLEQKPPLLIILFIMAIILSVTGYYFFYIVSNGTDMKYNDLNAIIAECSSESNYYSVDYAYNKNGSTMKKSLETISNILDECRYCYDVDKIDNMIFVVNNVDLSKEYDEYRDEVTTMLQSVKNFFLTGKDEYLDDYNNSDYMEKLERAFTMANVRYERNDDGSISFWYYPDPDPFKD